MTRFWRRTAMLAATALVFASSACASHGALTQATSSLANNPPQAKTALGVDNDRSVDADFSRDDGPSVLKRLTDIVTIGSTIDPLNGDLNPYGLDIAKTRSGAIRAGDLVVCNFNDSANVQGTGTTIVALHPQPGSNPVHIAQSAALNGCDEVALAPNDLIWASAFAANDNPIVSTTGALLTTLSAGPFHGPFGEAFAPHAGSFGEAAFYESNASDGSIVRIGVHADGTFSFAVIAAGFAVNHGVPGSILGPSGLQYDAQHDRLYIVDGANNTLVAFRHVSSIPAGGISVSGMSFGGPFAKRARLIFSGAPLNGPISSALLADGHLVLGNTLDPNGENLMVEIAPNGRLLDIDNVDTGAAGALFGMAASGRGDGDTKIFFNDDNANAVEVLTR